MSRDFTRCFCPCWMMSSSLQRWYSSGHSHINSSVQDCSNSSVLAMEFTASLQWAIDILRAGGLVQKIAKTSVDTLTHWGRVTHICVSDLTSIGSDNGLSPGRRQAIIRTNAGILLIRPLGTNFGEFLVEILIFSFKKMRLKVSSAKRRPFCLGFNELMTMLWSEIGRVELICKYQTCKANT